MAEELSDLTETPFERKSCYDCSHMKGYVSLWCTNDEAADVRGTHIPGVIHCTFWDPHYGRLSKEARETMEDYGYQKPPLVERGLQILEAKMWV